jgi:hypothetical protein
MPSGTPVVTHGEISSSLTPKAPTPPTGGLEASGPSEAKASRSPAKTYIDSLMREFGLEDPYEGSGVKKPTPPKKK